MYRFLTSKERDPDYGGEIRWNFTKFPLDRDGKVMSRFGPSVGPMDATITQVIEMALRRGQA